MAQAADFDSRERSSKRLAYALAVFFYASAYALCRYAYGPVLGFVVSSPVLGAYAALLLLYRSESLLLWVKYLTLRKIDGKHHAFQDVPVRVEWRNGQCWIRALDAFRVLEEQPDEVAFRRLMARFGNSHFIADECGDWWFSEEATMQWLDTRTAKLDIVAIKFQLWLRREVLPPMRRKNLPA